MQNHEIMINQWLDEDKEHLTKSISLIDDLGDFYESDFILEEKDGIINISNIFKWKEIIKNNNSNSNNRENKKINKKDNYNNNNNSIYNNEESKESKKNK